MMLIGRVFKVNDCAGWVTEVPLLNLVAETDTKEEIPEVCTEAIQILAEDKALDLYVKVVDENLFIIADNPERLMPLLIRSHFDREETRFFMQKQ